MPRLSPCPSCQSHVFADERTCPHCGAALRSAGVATTAAMIVGLALSGCTNNVEPVYGVPESDSGTTSGGTDEVDNTGEAEYGVPDTGDFTTSDSSTSDTGTTGEPEYGVPDTGVDTSTSDTTSDTGTTAEPLYGLADSGEQ